MKPAPLRLPEEVAARLQVGVKTVRALACARKLVGIKVGPAWRFADRDVEAYIAAGRRPPIVAPPPVPAPRRRHIDLSSLMTEPRRFS